MSISLKFSLLLISLTLFMSACTPASGRGFAHIWYVATTGADTNRCDEPGSPCLTLAGVMTKARATNTRLEREYAGEMITIYHTINVAAGRYDVIPPFGGEGYPFVTLDLNVTVIGAGQDTTIFHAANTYGGIFINGEVEVSLRDFTVRNTAGTAPDSCINIRGEALVTIERVTVRNCLSAGITNLGSALVTLIDVTAHRNLSGVSNRGDLHIEGGHFFLNASVGIGSVGTLTMSGGLVDRNQSHGIALGGEAMLDGVEIVGNGTDGHPSRRAGLFLEAEAIATVSNSSISENEYYGVFLPRRDAGASLTLIDTSVTGHPRTGIHVEAGELRLTRTLVAGNASLNAGTSMGGGLTVGHAARAILHESEVSGNLHGGIRNDGGELFLVESLVSANDGGLPALFNGEGATTVIEQSLIANNTMTATPDHVFNAVENRGTMNIVNSTISGNQGAGIVNFGALNLAYSTVAFNTGDGLSLFESTTTWLAGDIIAGHEHNCQFNGAAPLTYDGANIDTDGSCSTTLTIPLADLLLDALADNGGRTLTHALLPGSPAINAATSSPCPADDQRLFSRPFGPSCDLGAYEAGGSTLSLETTLEIGTPTPELTIPLFVFTQNALCRSGPSTSYPAINSYNDKDEIVIAGRNTDNSWFRLAMQPAGHCWVSLVTGEPKGPWQDLPIFGAPPTATTQPGDDSGAATHTPQPTVTATCYYDQNKNYICP